MDDQYVKESCKSYHKCQVANSARRHSLQKKTLDIEHQRKLASHVLSREERQLREQLKNMKMELAKNSVGNGPKGGAKSHKKSSNADKELDLVYVEPYPVTFAGYAPKVTRQRSMTAFDEEGTRYASRRGRRQSKEFEDLTVNTSTGQLAIPPHILGLHCKSPLSSASSSPMSPRRALNGSLSSLGSTETETLHWPGDPEAIHSVRRPRKSVEQLGRERVSKMKGEALRIL